MYLFVKHDEVLVVLTNTKNIFELDLKYFDTRSNK